MDDVDDVDDVEVAGAVDELGTNTLSVCPVAGLYIDWYVPPVDDVGVP